MYASLGACTSTFSIADKISLHVRPCGVSGINSCQAWCTATGSRSVYVGPLKAAHVRYGMHTWCDQKKNMLYVRETIIPDKRKSTQRQKK